MKIAIEAPYLLSEHLIDITDFEFCRVRDCKNKEYKNYFKGHKYDREIILYNGTFESEKLIPNNEYIDIFYEIEPSIVTLPDISKDFNRTLTNSEKFMKKILDTGISKNRIMGIIQGENEREYYLSFIKYFDWGLKIIGIPYGVIDRKIFLQNLEVEFPNYIKKLHFHILNIYDPYDIAWFGRKSYIKTMNTDMPIKMANGGFSLPISYKPKKIFIEKVKKLTNNLRILANEPDFLWK